MKLQRLGLKNFLSFKSLTHDFIDAPVLIQGKNLTEIDSKESNGAGKSTMMAGIAYALLANPLRKQVLDKDLITWGEEEAEIWLDIFCPVRNQTLNIHRIIRVKGSSTLELTLDGEANSVQYATVNDGNAYILKWIGISAEDLKNYYIINKENFKSFVSSSNTDKLSIISRFIKAEQLDTADNIIKDKNTPLQTKLYGLERELNKIEGELNVYTCQLEEEKARNIEEEKQNQLDALDRRIDEIVIAYDAAKENKEKLVVKIKDTEDIIKKLEGDLHASSEELKELESIDFSEDYDKLKEDRKEFDKQFTDAENKHRECLSKKTDFEVKINRLKSFLKGSITCPKCKHEFILNSEISVEDAKKDVAVKEKDVITIVKEADKLKDTIAEINKRLAKFEEERKQIKSEEDETIKVIREIQTEITSITGKIQRAKTDIASYQHQINMEDVKISALEEESENITAMQDKLEKEGVQTRVEELEGLVKLTTKKLDKAKKEVDNVQNKISENNQWGLRFKEFKMSLACEQLRLIQNFANITLEKQNSELRVSIEGFKKDSKGKIKSEITVLVINGEGEFKSFWSFSGGERARIEVALIQALQEMINGTNPYGGLYFLNIDEVLEGTDPLGLSLLMESLEGTGYPIYVISHVMNIRGGVKTLNVIKENGYSYIK